MKDILGREVQVGDIVAVGARSGNGGEMSHGEVLALDPNKGMKIRKKRWDWGGQDRGFSQSWSCPKGRFVIITREVKSLEAPELKP